MVPLIPDSFARYRTLLVHDWSCDVFRWELPTSPGLYAIAQGDGTWTTRSGVKTNIVKIGSTGSNIRARVGSQFWNDPVLWGEFVSKDVPLVVVHFQFWAPPRELRRYEDELHCAYFRACGQWPLICHRRPLAA